MASPEDVAKQTLVPPTPTTINGYFNGAANVNHYYYSDGTFTNVTNVTWQIMINIQDQQEALRRALKMGDEEIITNIRVALDSLQDDLNTALQAQPQPQPQPLPQAHAQPVPQAQQASGSGSGSGSGSSTVWACPDCGVNKIFHRDGCFCT